MKDDIWFGDGIGCGHVFGLCTYIRWQPADRGNVEVLHETGDYYRFFDAAPHAELLFSCVQRTIEEDLPSEADDLRRHDLAVQRIMNTVEMPDPWAADLVMFVRQNGGSLSRKRREREFTSLTDEEVGKLEDIVRNTFEGASDSPSADGEAHA